MSINFSVNMRNFVQAIGRLAEAPRFTDNADGTKTARVSVYADQNYTDSNGNRGSDVVQFSRYLRADDKIVNVLRAMNAGDSVTLIGHSERYKSTKNRTIQVPITDASGVTRSYDINFEDTVWNDQNVLDEVILHTSKVESEARRAAKAARSGNTGAPTAATAVPSAGAAPSAPSQGAPGAPAGAPSALDMYNAGQGAPSAAQGAPRAPQPPVPGASAGAPGVPSV